MALFKVLQSPALGLQALQQQNSDWYLKQLQSDRQQKRQVDSGELARGWLHPFESTLSFKDIYGAVFF